jgi:crotonobetainyl-CoA:carnitine CoA-transferase CaiB-like acyl-CoA transferase
MEYALQGIKVLDLAINFAGPLTSLYLADQGAEVIKIERRLTGDTSRQRGTTPFLGLDSRHFMAINRGKRSITLDITQPDGQQIVQQLARRADVLVENFRPGVMDRLGIGYDALSAVNPGLIYASLTAYGTKGPYADKAGFDRLVQGMTGAFQQDTHGQPRTAGVQIADWSAPMLMAFGIMLALRVRDRTRHGQRVESSLLQAAIAMQMANLTVVENDPTPARDDDPAGYRTFACSDGVWINVSALFPHQYARLCDVLDVPHLADQPKRAAAYVFQGIFETRPAQEWIALLQEADVPCAPLVTRSKVAYQEQVIANEMIVPLTHPRAGPTRVMGVPLRLSTTPHPPLRSAPALGEDTDAILSELGYDAQRIAEFRATGVT